MSEFRFSQPENLGVFVCDNVRLRGMSILYVSHDEEGDWQFLCGGTHEEGSHDGCALVCLREIVERDQSLNELAALCSMNEAERERHGEPWRVHDRMEDAVRGNVAEHACHVMKVPADDEGPGFAYSIGLTKTYGQPEVICFGLSAEVMHWMINELRDRMANGETFADGQRVTGLIEGYDCELRKVRVSRYREFLGYALWFYAGDEFEALQIVWPDKARRFPWDDGYSVPVELQPATW
jgi:hypothetical protein